GAVWTSCIAPAGSWRRPSATIASSLRGWSRRRSPETSSDRRPDADFSTTRATGARRSRARRCGPCSASSAATGAPDVSYFRATDPFPLESADHTKLHEFYTRLAAGRLATTRCTACGRLAWPPRGFCGECGSDRFDWTDLSGFGTIHAFTVQEAGLPAGFAGPRAFAIVKTDGLRVFSNLLHSQPPSISCRQGVQLCALLGEPHP